MKILLFLSLFFFLGCRVKVSESEIHENGLSKKIDKIISKHDFIGVILITSDTSTIYSKTTGFSDIENQTKLHLDDQFVIGSISKQITAILVLREYEKGRIELTDTISKYLSVTQEPWIQEVTIHQLLTHTHGIIDLKKPLNFEPGTQFQYSQLGYDLLAQILEKVSGKSFQQLSTELFEEYNLNNTFHPDNKTYNRLVKGYEENENGELEFAKYSLYNFAAAGSFISNAEDLTKWNQLLHSGKLVNENSLELMKTKFATRNHPIFETVEYGYGLLFKDGEANVQIGALGYAPGFASALYYYPKTNLNLVVLENVAKNLDDFKKTFVVHTEVMETVKNLHQ